MENKENDSDEMPKLSTIQNNAFIKMKLSLENGAIFGGNMEHLHPEIEAQFLDSILKFEENHKNVKQISVFERIGKPDLKKASEIIDEKEIGVELAALVKRLYKNNIGFEVLYEYDDEARLLYTFITEELFNVEIDDFEIKGMKTHFTYEEFHPNHKCDLESETYGFVKLFLDKKSKLYKKHHSKDAENHEVLNDFRNLFKKFKLKTFLIREVFFDEENAKTTFEIDFWGKVKGSTNKIKYSGLGMMTFEFIFGYWHVKMVDLPTITE
jgi:hypothetical protein